MAREGGRDEVAVDNEGGEGEQVDAKALVGDFGGFAGRWGWECEGSSEGGESSFRGLTVIACLGAPSRFTLLCHGSDSRQTVVALLSPASTPPGARSELKKLLASRQVRKTIADNIITRVFSGGTTAAVQPAEIPLPADDAASDGLRSGAATPAPGAAAANSSTNPGDEISIVYVRPYLKSSCTAKLTTRLRADVTLSTSLRK